MTKKKASPRKAPTRSNTKSAPKSADAGAPVVSAAPNVAVQTSEQVAPALQAPRTIFKIAPPAASSIHVNGTSAPAQETKNVPAALSPAPPAPAPRQPTQAPRGNPAPAPDQEQRQPVAELSPRDRDLQEMLREDDQLILENLRANFSQTDDPLRQPLTEGMREFVKTEDAKILAAVNDKAPLKIPNLYQPKPKPVEEPAPHITPPIADGDPRALEQIRQALTSHPKRRGSVLEKAVLTRYLESLAPAEQPTADAELWSQAARLLLYYHTIRHVEQYHEMVSLAKQDPRLHALVVYLCRQAELTLQDGEELPAPEALATQLVLQHGKYQVGIGQVRRVLQALSDGSRAEVTTIGPVAGTGSSTRHLLTYLQSAGLVALIRRPGRELFEITLRGLQALENTPEG